MQRILLVKVFILIFLITSSAAFASSSTLRCGNKIIKTGNTTIEVKLICGQPFDAEFIGVVKIRGNLVNVDRYTYVFAKGSLAKILDFHNGELVSISNGPRID